MSTVGVETIGSLTMDSGDIVLYDTKMGTARLYVDVSSAAGTAINVDALHLQSVTSTTEFRVGDSILFSTDTSGSIPGLTWKYQDEDLIKLLKTDSGFEFTLFQDFTGIVRDPKHPKEAPNIDAMSIVQNGNIALSTDSAAIIKGSSGGIEFDDNALVEFIPPDSAVSLIDFNEVFDGNTENVDAVHEVSPDVYALSIIDDAKTVEGTPVFADDVLLWDTTRPEGQKGSLLFAKNKHPFSSKANIDALYVFPATTVPEPGTLALMSIALVFIWADARSRSNLHTPCE